MHTVDIVRFAEPFRVVLEKTESIDPTASNKIAAAVMVCENTHWGTIELPQAPRSGSKIEWDGVTRPILYVGSPSPFGAQFVIVI